MIGIARDRAHNGSMKRLCALSALLSCLAMLATGAPAFALAWAPAQAPATDQTAVSALCSQHCPSCEGMPCPPTAAGCVVACVGVAPAIGVAAATLAIPSSVNDVWPPRLATLHGLSPPPDPLPPRS
jgi:hypothetical protein